MYVIGSPLILEKAKPAVEGFQSPSPSSKRSTYPPNSDHLTSTDTGKGPKYTTSFIFILLTNHAGLFGHHLLPLFGLGFLLLLFCFAPIFLDFHKTACSQKCSAQHTSPCVLPVLGPGLIQPCALRELPTPPTAGVCWVQDPAEDLQSLVALERIVSLRLRCQHFPKRLSTLEHAQPGPSCGVVGHSPNFKIP